MTDREPITVSPGVWNRFADMARRNGYTPDEYAEKLMALAIASPDLRARVDGGGDALREAIGPEMSEEEIARAASSLPHTKRP